MKSKSSDQPHAGTDHEQNFTSFVQAVGPRALRIAYHWTQNRQISEDLVQEAFLRVWRSRTVRVEQPLAWFYRILWHVFLDYSRRERCQEAELEGAVTWAKWNDPYTRISDRMDIAEWLAKLPKMDRYLLSLRYGEDFTFQDISSITGIPAITVRVKIHRALKRVQRHALGQTGLERSHLQDSSDRRGIHGAVRKEAPSQIP